MEEDYRDVLESPQFSARIKIEENNFFLNERIGKTLGKDDCREDECIRVSHRFVKPWVQYEPKWEAQPRLREEAILSTSG